MLSSTLRNATVERLTGTGRGGCAGQGWKSTGWGKKPCRPWQTSRIRGSEPDDWNSSRRPRGRRSRVRDALHALPAADRRLRRAGWSATTAAPRTSRRRCSSSALRRMREARGARSPSSRGSTRSPRTPASTPSAGRATARGVLRRRRRRSGRRSRPARRPGATPDDAVEGKIALDNLCGAFGGLSQVASRDPRACASSRGSPTARSATSWGSAGSGREHAVPCPPAARARSTRRSSAANAASACAASSTTRAPAPPACATAAGWLATSPTASRAGATPPCRRRFPRRARGVAGRTKRVAAFLPLPAFLQRRSRRRRGRTAARSAWRATLRRVAQVAGMLDPATVSGWTKAVATVATVAVAGLGAGAAIKRPRRFGQSSRAYRVAGPSATRSATRVTARRRSGASLDDCPRSRPRRHASGTPAAAPPATPQPANGGRGGARGRLPEANGDARQPARQSRPDSGALPRAARRPAADRRGTRRAVGQVLEVIRPHRARAPASLTGVGGGRLKGPSVATVVPGAGDRGEAGSTGGGSVSRQCPKRVSTTTSALGIPWR